jgi:hypothetical protein
MYLTLLKKKYLILPNELAAFIKDKQVSFSSLTITL